MTQSHAAQPIWFKENPLIYTLLKVKYCKTNKNQLKAVELAVQLQLKAVQLLDMGVS
jgi:hypothetical protein